MCRQSSMAAEVKKEIELEIAHVLFIDIVGYSKLLINDQRRLLDVLNQLVRGTKRVRAADAAGKLIGHALQKRQPANLREIGQQLGGLMCLKEACNAR